MAVLSDTQIKERALKGMITPFVDKLITKDKDVKVLSYGLSSYGYDIRLSPSQCLLFGGVQHGVCDPKDFDPDILKETELHEDERGRYFILPPFGYCLGVAVERLALPRDVTVVAVGKSTYARTGIICNVTPIENEFEGNIVIELSNTTPNPAKVYSNEGIAQFLFFKSDTQPETTYKSKNGKYQGQTTIQVAKIKK